MCAVGASVGANRCIVGAPIGAWVRRGCIRRCILENGSIKDKESPAANLLTVSKKAAGLFINLYFI